MTDIFREVEEDVRRERFEKLWKQYGDYMIAAAAVVIIAIAGYELWQRYEQSQREKASADYNVAIGLFSADPSAAAAAFEKLSATGPAGYAKLAKLAQADALLAGGNRVQAIALYESIAEEGKGPIDDAARIRAAWTMADSASKSDLQNVLAPLTDPTSPWRHMAREILAFSDYRAGKLRVAESEYRGLAADTDAPAPLRQRAKEMAAFMKAGGDQNFGYVPPVARPALPTNGTAPAPSQQGSAPQ